MNPKPIIFGLILVTVVAIAFGIAQPTRAAGAGATITVTTHNDEFDRSGSGVGCSLREAIKAANQDKPFGGCPKGNGDDTITLSTGTYVITRTFDPYGDFGFFSITSNLTLNGSTAGTTYLDGGGTAIGDPVIDIVDGSTVTLNRLVIHNGASDHSAGALSITGDADVTVNDSVIRNNRAEGGGVYNEGRLTLNRVSVRDNRSNGQAGGIFNDGTLSLVNTTVHNNYADANGGGVWNNGIAILRSSTISANYARQSGGGIESYDQLTAVNITISGNRAGSYGGGLHNLGNAHLYSTTIVFNKADVVWDGDGAGGGVYSDYHPVVIHNTLIGDNVNQDGVNAFHADDCTGDLELVSFNLLETITGCDLTLTGKDNLFFREPQLEPLAINGGRTRTHALQANSWAIDADDPDGCTDSDGKPLAADQRHYFRASDGNDDQIVRCDIGAYEYNSLPILPPLPTLTVPTKTPTNPSAKTATPTPTATKTATPTKTATKTPTKTMTPSQCTARPGKPVLSKPANNASLATLRVALDWNDLQCANSYKVRVKRDAKSGATADQQNGLTQSKHQTKTLDKGHTYYWHVLACNSHGCRRSTWKTFTIQ